MDSIVTRLNSLKLSVDGVVFAVRLGYMDQVAHLSKQASQVIARIPPSENFSYQQVLAVFASLIECMDLAYYNAEANNDRVEHWEISMRIVTDLFPSEHLLLSDLCKL